MQVGNKVIAVVFVLEVDVLTNGSKVIAPMKSSGWLYSRENSHVEPTKTLLLETKNQGTKEVERDAFVLATTELLSISVRTT